MVSAQGMAELLRNDPSAFNGIGKVVLWDGPDATQSLKNMGLAQAQIRQVSDKITYYVNPLDVVSMLNRTSPINEQLGHVKYMVPLNFNSTLDTDDSAHDFGEFQLDEHGNPLTASASFHPELITEGKVLADLIQNTLKQLKGANLPELGYATLADLLAGRIPGTVSSITRVAAEAILAVFLSKYQVILNTARTASQAWDKTALPRLQEEIRNASGSKRVALRSELVDTVAQSAALQAQDYTSDVTRTIAESKQGIRQLVNEAHNAVCSMTTSLSGREVEEILATFQFNDFWDERKEEETLKSVKEYQTGLEQFSSTLLKAASNVEQMDREGAAGFESLMSDVKKSWGK